MVVKTKRQRFEAEVYCPICTHQVPAQVYEQLASAGRHKHVVAPGQKCARCWTSLDAAFIVKVLPTEDVESSDRARMHGPGGLAA